MNMHTDIQRGNDPHPRRITIPALVAVLSLHHSSRLWGARRNPTKMARPEPVAQVPAGHAEGDGHDHGHGGEETHTDEVKLTADAVERYGIKIEAAQMWARRPTIVTPARVGFNAEAMAHVGSPLRGRVVEIKVRLGQDVKKGDELCVIESPELWRGPGRSAPEAGRQGLCRAGGRSRQGFVDRARRGSTTRHREPRSPRCSVARRNTRARLLCNVRPMPPSRRRRIACTFWE